ncbi:unnamed protein product [Acanthosepion pharaonis]|uniref:Peptidase A2 domain-containing protein n=1 Tax=Acanthosepion pharaonis TaxID=158019 RepID=A0A812CVE4_ACAPH|nr:unnamed protein product [Sepia pharaonis]
MSFLIDTGAQLSVVPPSPNFTKTNSSVTLRAANGTNIKTFGEQSLTLDIGLRRTYQWIFTIADVKFPILGADFLAHYQLIVDLSQQPVKHNTVHRIRTTEQPVYSKPRRLAPDKYKDCRAKFQHMLDLGIIRPSSRPYASPLHMVTKAQQGAWKPCGDYRRLNSQYPISTQFPI